MQNRIAQRNYRKDGPLPQSSDAYFMSTGRRMKEKIKSLEQQLIATQEDMQFLKLGSEIGLDIPVADTSQLSLTTSLWDWNAHILWNQCMETGYFLPDTSTLHLYLV